MSDRDAAHGQGEHSPSEGWQTAATMLQDAAPIAIPEGASAMTVHVGWEPGDPGTTPHRHSGPALGYVTEGAVRFEPEGEPMLEPVSEKELAERARLRVPCPTD
ncbi:hypothetical protein ACWGJB_00115 [Streptomyces sp. NPDC054813]